VHDPDDKTVALKDEPTSETMVDGNVALIFDVAGLVKAAHEEKNAQLKAGGRS